MRSILTVLSIFFAVSQAFAQVFYVNPKTVKKLREICREAGPGDTIVFEEGIYKRVPWITCNGAEGNPIVITSLGEKPAVIKAPVVVKGNYLKIENLYFRGYGDELNYEEVINHWWHPTKKVFKPSGLKVTGNHILIENNGFCYSVGSGLRVTGNSNYITIKHNIICNNAWWSTAGTGGLIVRDIDNGEKPGEIRIEDNLIFSNESRIISHVFKKGFTKMVIDEGEGLLIQQDGRRTFGGKFIVRNNLFLYNGKGISLNKSYGVSVLGNKFYHNGTTLTGTGGSIVCNRSKGVVIESNEMEPLKGKKPIKLMKCSDVVLKNNRFIASVSEEDLSRFSDLLNRFRIRVKPTNYRVNLKKEILDIVKRIPKKKDTKLELKGNKLYIYNIDNEGIKGLPGNYVLIIPKEYVKDVRDYLNRQGNQ